MEKKDQKTSSYIKRFFFYVLLPKTIFKLINPCFFYRDLFLFDYFLKPYEVSYLAICL